MRPRNSKAIRPKAWQNHRNKTGRGKHRTDFGVGEAICKRKKSSTLSI